MNSPPIDVIIVGTDTDVGKSYVSSLLVHSLRLLQRTVWAHKPVACGDWQDGQADDGRLYATLADPQQDPQLVCPLQFPEAASPHLAAAAAGAQTRWRDMADTISSLRGDHDLIIEAAGGILAPLSTDGGTICDIAHNLNLPVVLVTRPHLGTLNHTQLTVRELQRQNINCLGICINDHHHNMDHQSLALRTVDQELTRLCKLPILAHIAYGDGDGDTNTPEKSPLAHTLLAIHAREE